jgi:ketosteroid isomerase-like protein
MSQENVELLREFFAIADVNDASETWHPEIEWVVAREHPEARTLNGREAVIAYFRAWEEILDDPHIEMDRFIDADVSVVAVGTVRGTGTGSGADVQVPIALVCTLMDGMLIHVEEYLDPNEALDAVGPAGQAMSEENVQIVQRAWQAFADDGLDALVEFFDREITWRAIEGAPDDVGEMQGKDAVRRYLQDWLDTFEDVTTVPTELVRVGDGQVVAVLHARGRARLSRIETELRYAVLYTLRGGKIVRGREYADRQQALEAAGLAE